MEEIIKLFTRLFNKIGWHLTNEFEIIVVIVLIIICAIILIGTLCNSLKSISIFFSKLFKTDGIKVIDKITDEYVDQFIELYKKRIKDDERVTPEEIITWCKEDNTKDEINPFSDITLLAVKHNKLFGFIYVTYYYKSNYLFVSYLVSNNEITEAYKIAAIKLIRHLESRTIKKKFKDCKGIIADVEQNDEAKIELFKSYASHFGHYLWVLNDLPYVQPDLKQERSSEQFEKDNLLILIKTNKEESNLKPTVQEKKDILHFMYLDIYYDSYQKNNIEVNDKYKAYLRRRYEDKIKEIEQIAS